MEPDVVIAEAGEVVLKPALRDGAVLRVEPGEEVAHHALDRGGLLRRRPL
jgi:hypothetical protein